MDCFVAALLAMTMQVGQSPSRLVLMSESPSRNILYQMTRALTLQRRHGPA